ncbi:sensor histidine kinase [Cellulosimicrobium marinum]|uniref:sensor histidine kinase n=1 Tax=Cellulosimicrobium marinum TaxID=1638992 RepID=UPI001E60F182|nr:sensor histidine kinase [Cellulosimicrobium marinum]MCB7136800.1 sensor histidine kinase [Cellulosimicrobium marinum]
MTTADGARAVGAPADPGAPPRATDELDGTWARDVRWWDVAFYVIVTLSALALVVSEVRGPALAVAMTATAVLLVAYTTFGRRAARTRDQVPAHLYLLVAVAATVVVAAQDTLGTLLLFAVFTQIWMLSEHLWAQVVLCVVLAGGTALALAWDPATGRVEPSALASTAPQMGVALAFSLGLGLWTAHTMRQAERHARLVDALRATQAELARSHHEAGVAAERDRVAQEIHDTLAQGFTSVVMLAQAARADLDRGAADAARERLGLVEATARDNLAEARALVAASGPAPLMGGGTLGEVLARLAGRFEAETGVVVSARLTDVAGLSSADEVVLLRSAQEALANVRRHAAAHAVRIVLAQDGVRTRLEVHDDGRGLPGDVTEGYGLRGMRERVAVGGGTVRLGPGSGGGTSVVVELPRVGDPGGAR